MATDVGPSALIKGYIASSAGISFNLNGVDTDGQSKLYASSDMTFEKEYGISSILVVGTSVTFESPEITIKDNIRLFAEEEDASITFENSNVYFDNITWGTPSYGAYNFIGQSSIKITTNSIGKAIIRGYQITGTVSLDVADGVQDGDTFSIEATDNQLIITDGEWSATPSTVGNVTTYTLAKAGPSKKQRLFYTYENGNRVLRFLRSGL